MTFIKAERKQHKPKLAFTGPSGSGKTFSALLIASGMGKRIAVIDTENGSASLYAGMDKGQLKGLAFDVLELEPPYTIEKYLRAIEAAQAAKYDVLVVDSISHAWAGEGGLLSKKEALDQRGGNSYTNWAGITKEHEQFKSRILNAEIILICTMRSKQDYVLEINDKGKQAPKKVGMAPIQRDGMEYEFTTVFDLAMDHNAVASKDRTAMFDGQIFKPTKKTGEQILAWLAGGKPLEAKKPAPEFPAAQPQTLGPEAPVDNGDEDPDAEPIATAEQIMFIKDRMSELGKCGISPSTLWAGIGTEMQAKVGREVIDLDGLTEAEASFLVDYLNRWIAFLSKKHAAKAAAPAPAPEA
jgi:hypothetical protein